MAIRGKIKPLIFEAAVVESSLLNFSYKRFGNFQERGAAG